MKPLQQLLDNDLILSFQEGNQAALETLVNRHKEKIFTSILFMVKDKYLAEDLFQDVFIKIIDTLRSNRYNEEGKFIQWALRIAHNLCVDYFRKVKRGPIISSDDKDVFDMLNLTNESADTSMIQSQTRQKLHDMLSHLPEEQREVIVLRHFADMSFKEIAQITNTSINTSLGRMRYGLINLRKMMVEYQIVL
ncbi:MAG: sigma-70 family RNA polymerase sigma factor [Hydrotalea flava]|uniref:sigma-70 family RNA polymerase sigma factor n=1 Tax=Hydrotalea TaxID=1004300 RepID=UPI000941D9B4|nr:MULTISPECIES: sigma-70 family RNA polymerase sigma factor [Hydrotalea]MBY0346666.1 sigma-70 family RNA polymerase sigma factor [Hydrotalea flava]NIM34652.1 sigma-70 family RNA polymerase sigma factor [Hydrotalea flava]NIM38037.1 sigma-70 family RNA polymerase sigma factor [Hydrotalea flava]NIN03207.1 sigma-70 family RNA polymerase sigma factor [Hydrotalea flava]NIN14895.1 sigma-70 family RNA polymerase sigma factor [Hydrotalea flava]